MSRNWSLFLVVAFVLGFGTKTYLDSLDKPADVSETTSSEQSVLFGENNQPVNVFDVNDPRIRIVYFGLPNIARDAGRCTKSNQR